MKTTEVNWHNRETYTWTLLLVWLLKIFKPQIQDSYRPAPNQSWAGQISDRLNNQTKLLYWIEPKTYCTNKEPIRNNYNKPNQSWRYKLQQLVCLFTNIKEKIQDTYTPN